MENIKGVLVLGNATQENELPATLNRTTGIVESELEAVELEGAVDYMYFEVGTIRFDVIHKPGSEGGYVLSSLEQDQNVSQKSSPRP
ncbi:hypothetical protein ACKF11_13935 [Methylobacillus sp. Pita2]|uniref:hypothetical protein n=1 Tax=Methylobacillus sp. Pita2 TaxID=3383245 RepID=UPI0038B5196A